MPAAKPKAPTLRELRKLAKEVLGSKANVWVGETIFSSNKFTQVDSDADDVRATALRVQYPFARGNAAKARRALHAALMAMKGGK